jgi:hypothetical protein
LADARQQAVYADLARRHHRLKYTSCELTAVPASTFEELDMFRGSNDGLPVHLEVFLKIFGYVTLYGASHA